MSDIIIFTIADEDYVESWFDYLSLNEKASQTFAVRSKTDKSPSTNKTSFLDVHAKRHPLDNAVRAKHERKARTQFPKRVKIKRNRCKKPQSASRLRGFNSKGIQKIYRPCEVYERCLYRENCEDCPLYGDLPF